MIKRKRKHKPPLNDTEMALLYAQSELPPGWTVRLDLTAKGPSVRLYGPLGQAMFEECHVVADAISVAVRAAQRLNHQGMNIHADRERTSPRC